MFAQYFGQYLLNRGLLTADQLQKAIASQKETRAKLGVMAINRGYMSASQVEIVHQMQMMLDRRFGEIAIELEFMTQEQVDELLASQPSAHLALSQALVDRGSMTYETFAGALQDYKQAYGLTDEQFALIVDGSIEELLKAVLADGMSDSSLQRDYIHLFAKNLIRFIDSDVRLEPYETDSGGYEWVAEQSIRTPDRSAKQSTAIGGTESSFLKLASKFAQEPVEEPGEMMEASVGEFLNLHNGIYLVNLSDRHLELDLAPQHVFPGAGFTGTAPAKTKLRVIGPDWEAKLMIGDLSQLA